MKVVKLRNRSQLLVGSRTVTSVRSNNVFDETITSDEYYSGPTR